MAVRKPLVLVSGEIQQLQAADWIDLSDDINLTVTSPITLTDDDIGLDETAVDHDNLLNYDANEHIDHTTVSISSGSGLTGGGTIDGNQTLALDINGLSVAAIVAGDFIPFWDITATATNKKITFANFEGTLDHDSLSGYMANEHIDWTGAGDNLSTSGSITTSTLTSGRVVLAGASGILEDSANLTFDGTILSSQVLNLPVTTSTVGQITQAGTRVFHTFPGSGSGLNLFIGASVGNFTLTSSAFNVGIGNTALDALTTGSFNIAIGVGAGTAIAGGSSNVCVGINSGLSISSGSGNFALGTSALTFLATGSNNVAVGTNTGYNILGSGNTCIGSRAGFTNTDSLGVYIGYFAGYYETGPDKLFIDVLIRSNEADGRVKALVYGVFATTTANQYFTVNGHLIALEDLTTAKVLTPEIKTDTSTPTDLTITTGAAKTIVLATSIFQDVQFPTSGAKVPASNAPTWETFTPNTNEYAFDVNDYLDLQANELFHGWKEGTNGHMHVHFTIKTAQSTGADRFVKFSMWIAYSDKDEAWVEQAVLSSEDTVPTGSSALQAFYLDIGDAILTNYLRGGQIKVRIKRIAATGGTEYADDVYVTQVGMHLEMNKLGSVAEAD